MLILFRLAVGQRKSQAWFLFQTDRWINWCLIFSMFLQKLILSNCKIWRVSFVYQTNPSGFLSQSSTIGLVHKSAFPGPASVHCLRLHYLRWPPSINHVFQIIWRSYIFVKSFNIIIWLDFHCTCAKKIIVNDQPLNTSTTCFLSVKLKNWLQRQSWKSYTKAWGGHPRHCILCCWTWN